MHDISSSPFVAHFLLCEIFITHIHFDKKIICKLNSLLLFKKVCLVELDKELSGWYKKVRE